MKPGCPSLFPALPALLLWLFAVAHTLAAPLSASSNDHGWAVLPGEDNNALLLHLPGDAISGTVKRVPSVTRLPVAIGADSNRVILAYAPASSSSGASVYAFRAITTERLAGDGQWIYSQPTSLPPLETGGQLIDLASFDGSIRVLVRIGNRAIEYELAPDADEWAAVELPDSLRESASIAYPIASSKPRILAIDAEAARTLYNIAPDHRARSLPPDTEYAVFVDDRLLAVRLAPTGEAIVTIADGPDLATINLGGAKIADASPISLPGRLVLLWQEPGETAAPSLAGPLRTAVVSLEAGVIYEGPALTAPPVTGSQLEVLAFVVISVAFSVGVFVLKPIRPSDTVTNFPAGTSLAPPSRRIFAVLVDALPSLYLAAMLWGISLGELLDVSALLTTKHGIRPLLAAGVFMIAHSAASEAIWGRTIGKFLAGCETIDRMGGRPGAGQAIMRNLMKVLAPPVVLMSLLNPTMPWPGSFGTYVVIPPPDDEHQGSDAPGDE